MKTALIIAHLVICIVLIIVVLLQQSKQEGLSGAIAGGADTFFGKNKGRTVDAMLKKVTAVLAVLFIAVSLVLAYISSKPAETKAEDAVNQTSTQQGDINATENITVEDGQVPSGQNTEAAETPAQ